MRNSTLGDMPKKTTATVIEEISLGADDVPPKIQLFVYLSACPKVLSGLSAASQTCYRKLFNVHLFIKDAHDGGKLRVVVPFYQIPLSGFGFAVNSHALVFPGLHSRGFTFGIGRGLDGELKLFKHILLAL